MESKFMIRQYADEKVLIADSESFKLHSKRLWNGTITKSKVNYIYRYKISNPRTISGTFNIITRGVHKLWNTDFNKVFL